MMADVAHGYRSELVFVDRTPHQTLRSARHCGRTSVRWVRGRVRRGGCVQRLGALRSPRHPSDALTYCDIWRQGVAVDTELTSTLLRHSLGADSRLQLSSAVRISLLGAW